MTSPRQERTRAVLAAAVRHATGNPKAAPRPGQLALVDDIVAAADPLGGHVAGVAPTGVGKSLAALSVAAVGAASYDERWIISTESISLQSQYLDKDAPVVSAAVKEVTGADVDVAVLKGWSNYVCAVRARTAASDLGVDLRANQTSDATARAIEKLRTPAKVTIDGQTLDGERVQPLVAWAMRQHQDPASTGDRGSYPGAADDREWAAVSVSTQECLGEAQCPLASICKPRAARDLVAEADIVITNHAMLAVQAANAVPVVLGSSKLGAFQGIIVDEAHTLPGQVRNQGQSAVSGRRINSLIRLAGSVLHDREPAVQRWVSDGKRLAEAIELELGGQIRRGAQGAQKIPEDQDPLAATGDRLASWIKTGMRLVADVAKVAAHDATIKAKRAAAALEQTYRGVEDIREHRVGTARWIEPPDGRDSTHPQWTVAQAAPVMVAGLINANLWHETMKPAEGGEPETRALTVAAISATLPTGFERDAALKTKVRHYPSPFELAYANSRLFIPRAADPADIDAVSGRSRWSGKVGFDTGKHAEWASDMALRLVRANGGSAIILTSTVAAGKLFVEKLRRAGRGHWHTYSQWDGESTRRIVAKWRDDHSSVLVGTRSLMTGVDAPGETNSLVIIDRVPRAASNPVDDARVEELTQAFDGDKWTADRLVYVSDATLLMEQGIGRLIRSVDDSGMVAILDPRLLNAGPYKYSTPVRQAYAKAYDKFPSKTSRIDEAIDYLRGRKAPAVR